MDGGGGGGGSEVWGSCSVLNTVIAGWQEVEKKERLSCGTSIMATAFRCWTKVGVVFLCAGKWWVWFVCLMTLCNFVLRVPSTKECVNGSIEFISNK